MPKKSKNFSRARPKTRPRVLDRLKRLTLGDLGEAVAGAWEGAKAILPFNVELKRYDAAATTTPGVAGSVSALFAPALGTDYNQRIGQSVRAETLECRFYSYGQAPTAIRILIHIDTDCAGAFPAVNGGATGLLESASITAPFNHLTVERHQVLYDEVVNFDPVGDGYSKSRMARIPLGHHVRFLGNAGTAADLGQGSIFLTMIDFSASTTQVQWNSRVSFVDN